MKNKRGKLLLEDIIFLVLNLLVFSVVLFFIISKMSGASVLEEKYAKEIALSIDSAKPGMMISLNMQDAMNIAEKSLGAKNLDKMVTITGNLVTVRLTSNSQGYTYSFFNDVKIENYYPDKTNGNYIFFIGGYNG